VRGDVQIEVTFGISSEGIVSVSARDPVSGAERSTTVKMSSGLSEEELQAIIARGRTSSVVQAPVVRSAGAEAIALPPEEEEEYLLDPPTAGEMPAAEREPVMHEDDEMFGLIDVDLRDEER
jgi:molecular chaperone DnaK (HSP70)